MKWIMVANTNDCRIYEYDNQIQDITLIDEINHPENRLKNRAFTTERPGHYQVSSTCRGAFDPDETAHDFAVDHFARELAIRLNDGRIRHEYDDVTLLMPSEMEGLVNKHLNKNIKPSIRKVIQKNLMHLSEHELKLYLFKVFNKNLLH